jgi:DNA mismatch endonuclease (patch repair protein)
VKKRRYRNKSTDIEKFLAGWLKKNNIYFKKEYRVDYFSVDFYIPSKKAVIQTDGCYWHFNPCRCNKGKTPTSQQVTQMMRDKSCNGVMASRGYKVIRLWECDIKNNWKECEKRLKKSLEE